MRILRVPSEISAVSVHEEILETVDTISDDKVLGHDKHGPIYHRDKEGRAVCGKFVATGKCLIRNRMVKSGRCRHHRDEISVPQRVNPYKIWGRAMPHHLGADYEEALKDSDLVSMRESIALLDAMLAALLRDVTSVPATQTLEQVVLEMQTALDGERLSEHKVQGWIDKLTRVSEQRKNEKEIRGVLRDRAELVRVETLRVSVAAKVMTYDQVLLLLGAVTQVILREVKDEYQKERVCNSLAKLISVGTGSESAVTSEVYDVSVSDDGETEAATSGYSGMDRHTQE